MDIEQFKTMLEVVEGLGENALEFGIWYLLSTQIPNVISSILIFVCVIFVAISIKKCIFYSISNEKDVDVHLKKIEEELGIPVSRHLDNSLRTYYIVREIKEKKS